MDRAEEVKSFREHFFKTKALYNFLLIALLYIFSGFNQFLLEFETGYLKGDIYWNVIFSSAFTVLGYIAGGLMLKKTRSIANKSNAFRLMFALSYALETVGAMCILCLQAKYP